MIPKIIAQTKKQQVLIENFIRFNQTLIKQKKILKDADKKSKEKQRFLRDLIYYMSNLPKNN